MALRTCPMCQSTAEPKMDGGRELCAKCELQLPPPDMKLPDPPERPRPKTVTARREKDWTRTPRSTEGEPPGKIGGFGLSVLLLVVAFVLLALFYATVIYLKTQKTTPATKPAGPMMRGNNPPNDPWGGAIK